MYNTYVFVCVVFHSLAPVPTVDCSAVLCLRPECDNPIRPPGQCCSICPDGKCSHCLAFVPRLSLVPANKSMTFDLPNSCPKSLYVCEVMSMGMRLIELYTLIGICTYMYCCLNHSTTTTIRSTTNNTTTSTAATTTTN